MDDHHRGLAAIAVTLFVMGREREAIENQLAEQWSQLGAPPGAFHAAAESIARFPQPIDEDAENADRRRVIGARIGLTSVEAQLTAAIEAADLLRELAGVRG